MFPLKFLFIWFDSITLSLAIALVFSVDLFHFGYLVHINWMPSNILHAMCVQKAQILFAMYTVHRTEYGMCTYARTISSMAYHSHWIEMNQSLPLTTYYMYHVRCTYNYKYTHWHWHFRAHTKSIEVFLSEFTRKPYQLHCETPAHYLVPAFSCNLIEFLFDFTQFFHFNRMI